MHHNKRREIDAYLCELRKTGSIDPNQPPKYSNAAWIHYWFTLFIDYPFIALFEITCLLLSIYGTIKAMYSAYNCLCCRCRTASKHDDASKSTADLICKPKETPFLSIIISCYNEANNIEQLLLYLEKYCVDKENTEIILIDDGSTDEWRSKLPKHNERLSRLISIPIKVIEYAQHKQTGRGNCQRIGVQYCHEHTNYLLFLRADTIVCDRFDEKIRNNLSKNKIVCGCFDFGLDCNDMMYPMPGFAALQWRVWLDTYLCWLPGSDQGTFISMEMYHKLGGLPNQCIMGDFEFMKKARKYALENYMKIHIENSKIYTSPKRYYKSGTIWRNTLMDQLVTYLYEHKGYSAKQCYQVYHNKK